MDNIWMIVLAFIWAIAFAMWFKTGVMQKNWDDSIVYCLVMVIIPFIMFVNAMLGGWLCLQ